MDSFKKLQTYIIITQIIAMAVYILYPNRQDLRPEAFQRENLATWILGIIYRFDTNTGVCPSLHVGYSLGIASTWLREKSVPKWGSCSNCHLVRCDLYFRCLWEAAFRGGYFRGDSHVSVC